jgi:hypothetical protein
MPELNKDVILLILEELQDNHVKSLYPYLLVNKTWCETTVPILWKNPVNRYYKIDKVNNNLFNVICSHLSEESKNNLKNQGIDLFTKKVYQRPSFNYIVFWRHLDLFFLKLMIDFFFKCTNIEKIKIPLVCDEILNLFNKNARFVFLNLINSQRFKTFYISGTEQCFSELETFQCNDFVNCNVLKKLAIKNTSIKELKFEIDNNINKPGIVRLIEVQKNLKKVYLICNYVTNINNESYHKILEESLIKCANTIQYLRIDWNPFTRFLSYLVNLVSLEIKASYDSNWSNLEEVSLPLLKFLKAHSMSSRILANLIKNTKGHLIEISILYRSIDDGKLIQTIYQNCSNLDYLKLSMYNNDIFEFEDLLINCQFLNRLEVMGMYYSFNEFSWNNLFKILTKFSRTRLFKFKFSSYQREFEIIPLKYFLCNWNDEYPMLLQIISAEHISRGHPTRKELQEELEILLRRYKTNGIIENYSIDRDDFEDSMLQ